MKFRVFVFVLVALWAAAPILAQTSDPTAPQAPAALNSALTPAATTTLQQRAEQFLRKLYAWGPDFQVKSGPVKPSPVSDLYEITVDVSYQGQSDSAVVYVSKDGRYMVRGEISDMDADPFAAIREKLVPDESPSRGPANASVVMVEFGDFECPSCRQLDTLLRELLPSYPQVRLVFKDFPLEQIHPWAMTAALVGRCAFQHSSDTFWKVHDLIYDNQDLITPQNAYDKLIDIASGAGLDPTALRACIADPQTKEAVRQTIAEGTSLDISSTPTTFVNGRTVVGPNEALLRQFLSFIVSR
jgi:protein-disulfide isomerase